MPFFSSYFCLSLTFSFSIPLFSLFSVYLSRLLIFHLLPAFFHSLVCISFSIFHLFIKSNDIHHEDTVSLVTDNSIHTFIFSCPSRREIMHTSVKNTLALVVTSQKDMLENLQHSEGLLDTIQKGLNDYLEKKRLFFPRWVKLCNLMVSVLEGHLSLVLR